MRRLIPLALFLATVAAVTGGVFVSGQSKVAVQAAVLAQTDSLRAETYRPRNLGPRKTVVRRLATRIDSILLAWVPDTVVRVDTVFVRDSVPVPLPDTSTPPPNPAVTLALSTTGGDTIRIRPAVPYMLFFTVRYDSAGVTSDSASFAVSDTGLAKTFWNKTARRLEVYTTTAHTRVGPLTITATRSGTSAGRTIYVSNTAPPPPPVDTTTPPPPPPINDSTALGIITTLIGPTRSPAEATALGGGYATIDPLFAQWEPTRFATDGTVWGGANYYDRALVYYAMAARHGNATWRQRGDALAVDYRRNYLHASNYQTSPHWAQLDGVALHFLLTGDDSSRIAVGKAAWNLAGTAQWPTTNPYNDARTQARALTAMLLAWQINAPNAPAGGWAPALDRGIDSVLAQQKSDGGWRYANTCNLSLNYMGAMLTDALIRVYEKYKPDPRIPPAVQRSADFLWTQWRPNDAVPSFNYYEALCSNQHGTGGPTATPDLTGLFTSTYTWLAKRDPAYRTKADAVFSGTMRGIYPQGSKQFNQAFTYSWRALGYLP